MSLEMTEQTPSAYARIRSRRRIAGVCALFACVLLPMRTASAAGIHAAIVPAVATAAPGDTVLVQLQITQADGAFNAFDAAVLFDSSRLAFVATAPVSQQIGPVMTNACNNFFHNFVAHADSLEIHVSMLCPNTSATGPGTIYRVRFRVLAPTGPTTLAWGPSSLFYNAGLFVRPLDFTSGTLQVGGATGVESFVSPEPAFSLEPPQPNPGRSGAMTLAFSAPAPRRVRFELFDTQGRCVATRDAGRVSAGRGSITWNGLRLEPGLYLVRMNAGAGSPPPRPWIVLR